MANFLYRLGRLSFRRRGPVLVVWLLLLGGLGAGFAAVGMASTASITIPGTESQRALDSLTREFPEASGAAGTAVIRAPEGESLLDEANQAVVLGVVQEANQLPGVLGAMSPYDTQALSEDGRYALLSVQFEEPADMLSSSEREAYEELGADVPEGWTVAAGGEPLLETPHISPTEAIGVAVALVVLVVTFGSMVAAGMTMVNALIGVGVGMLGLMLAGHLFDLTSVTPVLALMLGLAVGIDYSLFISSRYRHNIAIGLPAEEAAGRAVGTAGSAVVFAGLTVVIALAGLSVVGIPFLTSMGLAAAGTVAVAVLVAVTLLPALLSFAGDRVLSRRQRKADADAGHHQDLEDSTDNGGFRWGRLMVRLRIPVLIAGVAALGVLAIPATSMELALPDDGTSAVGTAKRDAYDLVAEGFGEGFNGRLVLVVSGDTPRETQQAAEGVAAEVQALDGVVAVAPPQPNQSGTTMLLSVIPETGPTDQATYDLVHDIRETTAGLAGDTTAGSVDVALTGVTALGIDVSEKLGDALPVYLLVVVGLSFALLMLVFRSILVPLKATLGFLLTVAATFGATVAIFQWGWLAGLVGLDNGGPLVSFLPIMLIGILFGLAMDYEVFLVSRMREDYVHGETAAEAIVSGVGHGARVVVAAALIMISVFAGFVFMDDPIIKSMGFALAFGVAVDAFIVRLSLVPAAMSFLGDKAWWLPRWMDKAMPNVDIEGESLRTEHEAEPEPAPA